MAYGGGQFATAAADFTTLALLNNSQYAEYLLIRTWSFTPNGNNIGLVGVAQTNFGGTAVTPIPFMPNEAPPPGVLTHIAATSAQVNGFVIGGSASSPNIWPLDIPFALVPPGWSFFIQQFTANVILTASVMWEAIMPEQLDEGAWLAANLTVANQ